MRPEPKKPLIVVSYAHNDEPEHPADGEVKWLSFVIDFLEAAFRPRAVEIWRDRLMPGGTDWEPEIAQKFRACDIFILLVSRYSMKSEYVLDKEIPIIRGRQAKGEKVHFYPLVLTPTPKAGLATVRDKNLRPRNGKPLSDFSPNERLRQMSEAADEIAEIAATIVAGESIFSANAEEARARTKPFRIFISYSRIDDTPPPGNPAAGYVKHFRNQLMWELRQRGHADSIVWMDADKSELMDSWSNVAKEALLEADFFIVVLSKNYLQREWCKKELEEIILLEKQLYGADGRRIFPVYKTPVPMEHVPDTLKNVNGLMLYNDMSEYYDRGRAKSEFFLVLSELTNAIDRRLRELG